MKDSIADRTVKMRMKGPPAMSRSVSLDEFPGPEEAGRTKLRKEGRPYGKTSGGYFTSLMAPAQRSSMSTVSPTLRKKELGFFIPQVT